MTLRKGFVSVFTCQVNSSRPTLWDMSPTDGLSAKPTQQTVTASQLLKRDRHRADIHPIPLYISEVQQTILGQ